MFSTGSEATKKKLSDSDLARKLQYEFEEEERLACSRREEEERTNIALATALQEELSIVHDTSGDEELARRLSSPFSTPLSTISDTTSSGSRTELDSKFFTIKCPYPSCSGATIDARKFPSHASEYHRTEGQEFACPVCSLFTGTIYTVKPGTTNLIGHIDSAHAGVSFGEYIPENMTYEQLLALEDNIGSVTTTAEVMASYTSTSSSFTIHTYKASGESECVICMDDFIEGDDVASLACLHSYHPHCIKKWLKKQRTCPVCKFKV